MTWVWFLEPMKVEIKKWLQSFPLTSAHVLQQACACVCVHTHNTCNNNNYKKKVSKEASKLKTGKQFLYESLQCGFLNSMSTFFWEMAVGLGLPAALLCTFSHVYKGKVIYTCVQQDSARTKTILLLYASKSARMCVCTCTCVEAKRQLGVILRKIVHLLWNKSP